MAATISNLSQLKAKKAAREAAEEIRNRPKATWFSLKPNETRTVQFLQELSDDASNYNSAFGTFVAVLEHTAHGPKGFLSRAVDTMESEGRDFAQEMYNKTHEAGWKAKENFYINVATVGADGKVEAQILSRNMYSEFVEDLVEAYEDSDGEGITGRTFTITRKGTGAQTKWKLKEVKEDLDVSGVEPWNLNEHAVRNIPYDQQREYYMRNYVPDVPEAEDEDSSNASSGGNSEPDLDW